MRRDRHAAQPDGAWFDAERAATAVKWFPRHLRHYKGEHYGKPLHLEPWQARDIEDLWGWRREDGSRLYRRYLLAVGRKNGKTTMAAGIGLALQIADGEPGAEVYSIAGNAEQAQIVFNDASTMAQTSPTLSTAVEALKESLYCPQLRSVFRPLAGKGRTQHGLNPHGVIGDEVHTWRGREQYEAMRTATGARRQPLSVYITTAGDDVTSVCWELWDYALKVEAGVIDDGEFLSSIYAADSDDDWTDEGVWRKANPNLGVSIKTDYLRAYCAEAQRLPSEENSFRRLHLNQWTEQAERWLPMAAWNDPANARPFDEAELIGRRCALGLDLAWTGDMSALALVFPPAGPDPAWRWVMRYFLPEEGLKARAKSDFVPYDAWARSGHLQATAGNVMDFDAYEAAARDLIAKFNPEKVGFDRMFAGEVIQHLMSDGVECVGVGQGFVSMALPCRELERAVMSRRMRHGGHPILKWNASNVVVRRDESGNMRPDKTKSRNKIDGVTAGLTAMALCGLKEETKVRSMYDDPSFVGL